MIAAPLVLSGCAGMAQDARANDLCTRYHELVTSANQLREVDPAQVKADELRARADRFRDQLNQVQAASDGQLDTAIANLQSTLDDLRQGAVEAGAHVHATVQTLWKDDLEHVAESWAALRQAADTRCHG